MVLDCHIHVHYLEDDSSNIIEQMKSMGVDGGVLFSVRPPCFPAPKAVAAEMRVDDVVRRAKIAPTLYPFLWIDPMEDDAIEQVRMAAQKGIRGFKIISSMHLPSDPKTMKVYAEIAKTDLPIIFHSGTIYADGWSNNLRPANWEPVLEIPKLRFALAHIGWPWCDEMIALFGRFCSLQRRHGAAYTTQLYVDSTPGTPGSFRQDALSRLFSCHLNFKRNLLFGTDGQAMNYHVKRALQIRVFDTEFYIQLGLDNPEIEDILSGNLLRFLSHESAS
jgi:predicted TIM-barrel fold metal-dependent hydrolase